MTITGFHICARDVGVVLVAIVRLAFVGVFALSRH